MSFTSPIASYRPLGSALFGGSVASRTPLGGVVTQVAFPSAVLKWQPLLERYAGSLPIPFLLAWIQKESNGNPCSYTSLRESGIFQLMPPGNTTEGSTSEAALRAACEAGTQKSSRPLTVAEQDEQVRSGLQYVNYTRDYARKYVSWAESNPDFWKMVKMVHVAPARVKQYAPGTSSWAEFRQKAAAGGDTPANWLDNAEWVGSFGKGGTVATLVLVGLAVAGALFYLHRTRRR